MRGYQPSENTLKSLQPDISSTTFIAAVKIFQMEGVLKMCIRDSTLAYFKKRVNLTTTFSIILIAIHIEIFIEIIYCSISVSYTHLTISLLHDKYTDLLRQYYYVGGMPEVVLKYVETDSH